MALIVVSNRVTIGGPGEKAAGGVAVALSEALRRTGGTWIGWSGDTADSAEPAVHRREADGISYALLDLTPQEYDAYYAGFANRALWPVMHYRLGLTAFSREDYRGYLDVNAAFARLVAEVAGDDDLVWVHDYHLMPLAHALAERGLRPRIGYFHHIPWPPPEVFATLPSARELLDAMMDYRVVGLQTAVDADHFGQCLRRELGAVEQSPPPGAARSRNVRWYRLGDRSVKVLTHPIGIDAAGVMEAAKAAASDPTVIETEASLGGRELIIGVDRLDYSKGVAQRIEAYAQFLVENPHRQGAVEYVQITPTSRADIPEYEAINHEVAETAGRVNGAMGLPSWTPVRYINRTYPRTVIAGLYRAARVGLVTPIRDGMNLVAKEFVASQDPRDPGVLVLSRFAGAARQLSGALLVNPFDRSAVASAIEQALSMPLPERRRRWRAMIGPIRELGVAWWVDAFLAHLQGPAPARDEFAEPAVAAQHGP
jgi:trehalose 6-phosphate synthase